MLSHRGAPHPKTHFPINPPSHTHAHCCPQPQPTQKHMWLKPRCGRVQHDFLGDWSTMTLGDHPKCVVGYRSHSVCASTLHMQTHGDGANVQLAAAIFPRAWEMAGPFQFWTMKGGYTKREIKKPWIILLFWPGWDTLSRMQPNWWEPNPDWSAWPWLLEILHKW